MKIRNVYTWIERRNARRLACYAYSAAFCARAAGKSTSQELRGLQECTDPAVVAACKAQPDIILAFPLTEDEVKKLPALGRPSSNPSRPATQEEIDKLMRGFGIAVKETFKL